MNLQDTSSQAIPPERPNGLAPDPSGKQIPDGMAGASDDEMDGMVDGDRQLTTDSDALDGGLNDSDLGSPRGADMDQGLGTGTNPAF